MAGTQRSCWSGLALVKASSSIFTLLAQLTLNGGVSVVLHLDGLQGAEGLCGVILGTQQDLDSKPEPSWNIRLLPLFPSMGLRCAGQPIPAQSYLVSTGHSSLKDGVRCLRLLL